MQRRKKILFGITKLAWGGAGRYVFDLATALSPGYEVAVMGGGTGQLSEGLQERGISVYELPGLGRDIRWFSELSHLLQLIQTIWKYQPDILHLNSPKMAGLGSVAGKILGIRKIVVTVHGWSFAEDRNAISKALIFFFSWLTIVFAHRVIVINTRDYDAALRLPFISKSKFRLLHNGAVESKIKTREEAREALIKILGPRGNILREAPVWIGTITELIENKDPETLVRAVGDLGTPTPCIIIGRGPKEKELKALLDQLGLDNIFFAGFVPYAARFLKAFDVFVLSSTKEGLPYVLLEAGLARVVVAATVIDGTRDIIEDGTTGLLVPPKSAKDMSCALDRLVRDRDLRLSLARNLEKKVREKFSFEKMLAGTTKIYEDDRDIAENSKGGILSKN